MKDPNVPYRLMRREVLQRAIGRIPANFNIHNVALTYAFYKDPVCRMTRLPIEFRARASGENSLDLAKVFAWGTAMLFELLQLRRSFRKARLGAGA